VADKAFGGRVTDALFSPSAETAAVVVSISQVSLVLKGKR
jgi:hypothetical protein